MSPLPCPQCGYVGAASPTAYYACARCGVVPRGANDPALFVAQPLRIPAQPRGNSGLTVVIVSVVTLVVLFVGGLSAALFARRSQSRSVFAERPPPVALEPTYAGSEDTLPKVTAVPVAAPVPSASYVAPGLVDLDELPSRSPASKTSLFLSISNRRSRPVQLVWIDFTGARKAYQTIAVGKSVRQQTYAGHVWVFVENGKDLGGFVATQEFHLLTVR